MASPAGSGTRTVESWVDALGGKRLVLVVENLGDSQIVVQFEDGDAQILQGSELHLGAGRDLVQMRFEGGVDLVVVHAQTGFVGGPRAASRGEGPTKSEER